MPLLHFGELKCFLARFHHEFSWVGSQRSFTSQTPGDHSQETLPSTGWGCRWLLPTNSEDQHFIFFFRIWSAGLSFSRSFTHQAQNLHRLAGSISRSARYGSAQLHLPRVCKYSGGGSYGCEGPVAREIHPRFTSARISGKHHLPFSLGRCFSEGHLAARRWKPWSCRNGGGRSLWQRLCLGLSFH